MTEPRQAPDPSLKPGSVPPPWNPTAIATLAFFLSILPGGILHALNYERLGLGQRKHLALAFNLSLAAILFLGAAFTDLPNVLFILFNGLSFFYLRNSQRWLYREHLARGGATASLRRPATYSVLGMVVVVVVLLGFSYYTSLRDQRRFDEGVALFNAGAYGEAEVIFRAFQARNPEERASYWNLALVYPQQADTPRASEQLRALVGRDPHDTAAATLLRGLGARDTAR